MPFYFYYEHTCGYVNIAHLYLHNHMLYLYISWTICYYFFICLPSFLYPTAFTRSYLMYVTLDLSTALNINSLPVGVALLKEHADIFIRKYASSDQSCFPNAHGTSRIAALLDPFIAGSPLRAVHPLYTYLSPLHVTPAMACATEHVFVRSSAPIIHESKTYRVPLYLIIFSCFLGLYP